jgi:hypothetical protein
MNRGTVSLLGGQLARVVAGTVLQPRPAMTVDIVEHDVDPAQHPAPGVGRQRQLRHVIQKIHQHRPREILRAGQPWVCHLELVQTVCIRHVAGGRAAALSELLWHRA